MAELTEAGCRAFTQADAPMTDTNVLLRAMEYAATFGFSLWLRPQDMSLAHGGVAHDGAVATRLGCPVSPHWPKRWRWPPFCSWRAKLAPASM